MKTNVFVPPAPMTEFQLFYANYRRERLLNNFPKFHASTYTRSWRISDESVFYIRKKLHLGPRTPLSVILNIVFACYHRGSVLINYLGFHASTYTGNMRILIFSFYIAHIRKELHLGPRPPGSDNLICFRLLPLRVCPQQLLKVSYFCLLGK